MTCFTVIKLFFTNLYYKYTTKNDGLDNYLKLEDSQEFEYKPPNPDIDTRFHLTQSGINAIIEDN